MGLGSFPASSSLCSLSTDSMCLLHLLYKVGGGSNELMNVEPSASPAIGSIQCILAVKMFLGLQKKKGETLT